MPDVPSGHRPAVFISSSVDTVHLAAATATLLVSEVNADVRLWDVAAFGFDSAAVGQLTQEIASADVVVAILGPRDLASSSTAQANTVFELGLAVGALGVDRVMVVLDEHSGPLPSVRAGLVLTLDLDDAVAAANIARSVVEQLGKSGLRARPARETVTVFLSYAPPDRDFAQRLASDLSSAGVSAWFDSNLTKGELWADRLREGLTHSDRVLVVLSSASVRSDYVRQDASWAEQREEVIGYPIAFPVLVDADVHESSDEWVQRLLNASQVADFSDWRNERSYQRSLRHLLQALSISADPSYSSWI